MIDGYPFERFSAIDPANARPNASAEWGGDARNEYTAARSARRRGHTTTSLREAVTFASHDVMGPCESSIPRRETQVPARERCERRLSHGPHSNDCFVRGNRRVTGKNAALPDGSWDSRISHRCAACVDRGAYLRRKLGNPRKDMLPPEQTHFICTTGPDACGIVDARFANRLRSQRGLVGFGTARCARPDACGNARALSARLRLARDHEFEFM